MEADATRVAVIRANLPRIEERIERAVGRAGRRREAVTLVAVSKTFPADAIRVAYEAGLRHFGENRVQEWESKRPHLSDLNITMHLVGHLQSNKARRAAQLFHRVDSVDSAAVAQKLDAAESLLQPHLGVLIEVHLGNEETKSGVAENDLPPLADALVKFSRLELLGLMTVPPFLADAQKVRPYFTKLRELRDDLSARIGRSLPVLSMGMSNDFEVAIEEGATEIRIGTALFGSRPAA
ncbi:MAG: YggS family pyridoxal phosphate-dependent enzyme [Candidatus Acidiferrales bacterium]